MLPEDIIILLTVLFLFFLALGITITYLIVTHSNRLNRLFFEKHQLINESKRMSLEEGERMMMQVSREVHDNIGHVAILASIKLNKAREIAINTALDSLLGEVSEHIEEVARESTNISHSINHNYIKAKNLHLLLGDELEYMRLYRNINYDILMKGTIRTLLPETKLLVYRVAQQAFNNILKHSDAREITLSLYYSDDSFEIIIYDNGIGMPAEKLHTRSGIGITNMMERAELLNGKLNIGCTPNEGCTVTLSLPNAKFLQTTPE